MSALSKKHSSAPDVCQKTETMMFLHTLLLAVTFLTSMQERLVEYRMQLKAYALYEQHSYREAEVAFEELRSRVNGQKEINRACFNLSCALYMQGKFNDAAPLFAQSAKAGSKYSELRQRAIFNEGDALAMRAIENKTKSLKTGLFRQSLNRFKTLLLTDANDGDAKINYEIVRRYLHELETPEKNLPSPPSSGINNNVANRLLDNAQQDESSLMRRPPRSLPPAGNNHTNSKDW